MFEKFGEMSSCREINELAENLLNEGDIQSLKVMAQENGIPEDYVELYRSSDIPYLCDNGCRAEMIVDRNSTSIWKAMQRNCLR